MRVPICSFKYISGQAFKLTDYCDPHPSVSLLLILPLPTLNPAAHGGLHKGPLQLPREHQHPVRRLPSQKSQTVNRLDPRLQEVSLEGMTALRQKLVAIK